MSISTIVAGLFNKLKSKFDLESGWLPFLNDQFKFAVGFFIRISAIVLTIIFVLFVIKFSGIVKALQTIAGDKQEMKISPKDSVIVSSPDINYNKDLKNVSGIIKMLKDKKQEKEGIKNEKDKTTVDNKNSK